MVVRSLSVSEVFPYGLMAPAPTFFFFFSVPSALTFHVLLVRVVVLQVQVWVVPVRSYVDILRRFGSSECSGRGDARE